MPRKSDEAMVEKVAGECLAVRLRVLHRMVSSIYDEALRPHGMTAGQLNILAVLMRAGETDAGAIGAMLEMEKSTVSRNLERMKRNGWVEALTVDESRRVLLRASRDGRRALREVYPAWEKAQRRTRALLGADADALFGIGDRLWARKLGV